MATYDICCSGNTSDIYNLPQITMFAGETETLIFNLLTEDGKPFDAADACRANFAVSYYHNQISSPIISKALGISYDESGYDNVVTVNFDVADTVNLRGRYVYQVAIKSAGGDYDVIGQGFITIIRNISKTFAEEPVSGDLIYGVSDPVSWSTGSVNQIVKMVEAADAGAIDLADYWTVGDERVVTLSAMTEGDSQEVTLVLMDSECAGFMLTNATLSGRTKPSFIVGVKDCITIDKMNDPATNVNGWQSCLARTWCNGAFKDSIPGDLLPIFKQFTWKTGIGGGESSGLLSSDDYFAIAPEMAVTGYRYCSAIDEGALYKNWEYYKTSANRIKSLGSSNWAWWLSSPYHSSEYQFCYINIYGQADFIYANKAVGLSPFGCI